VSALSDMNSTIETHFLSCLLMLGPPGEQAHKSQRGAQLYHESVIEWWETHVGKAGSHWYAEWFLKWVRSGCECTCRPEGVRDA